MKVINFKKAIEVLGYNIIKYSKGYNFRTAFATDSNGDMFYFSIEDLRDTTPKLMYRTARDTKDYTGGSNRWDMESRLERLGYKVKENRARCDYN
jgi:hypothetical protein